MSLINYLNDFNNEDYDSFNISLDEEIKNLNNYKLVFPILGFCRELITILPSNFNNETVLLVFNPDDQSIEAISTFNQPNLNEQFLTTLNQLFFKFSLNIEPNYQLVLNTNGIEGFKKNLMGEELYIQCECAKMQLELNEKPFKKALKI